MNKSNKKWLIGSSLILTLILVASIGTGAIIGATTKRPDNYIKFYINGQEYSSNEINAGTPTTSDQERALMIQAQFLTYAIFGTIDIDSVDTSTSDEYLLLQNDNWNTTYQIFRLDENGKNGKELLSSFVQMKFLNDTQNSSVVAYLYERMETSTNPHDLLIIIEQIIKLAEDEGNDPMQINGIDVINYIGEGKNNLFSVLLDDYSYQVEILEDIYTYMYLWQSPIESNIYDYNFTKELAYSKPSITWSMTYDGEKYETSPVSDAFINQIENYESISPYENIHGWNDAYDKMKDAKYLIDSSTHDDFLDIVDTNKYRGFKGITFGTSAGTGIDETWTESENIWNYVKTESANSSTTETRNGEATHKNVMNDVNVYVPKDNDGGGIVSDVVDDPNDDIFGSETGNKSIYLYNQLSPYIFKESNFNNDGIAEYGIAKFSLFANSEIDGIYSPYTGNPFDDGDNNMSSVDYIFDDWFGEKRSMIGEIYVVEAMLLHNSGLETEAIKYWQDQGFYIELSGTYEDDLLSFIPADMIKE